MECVRAIAQARIPLGVLRLSTPVETATLLAFADRPAQIRGAARATSGSGASRGDWALLLIGVAGRKRIAKAARDEAARDHPRPRRHRRPGASRATWSQDPLPLAVPAERAVDARLRARTRSRPRPTGRTCRRSWPGSRRPSGTPSRPPGERVHVFTHLSHLYPSGSSLYLTYIFRLAADPDETLERWRAHQAGGLDGRSRRRARRSPTTTASGADHAPYLAAEKGPLGMAALEGVVRTFDPDGIMNPGVLLSDRHGDAASAR